MPPEGDPLFPDKTPTQNGAGTPAPAADPRIDQLTTQLQQLGGALQQMQRGMAALLQRTEAPAPAAPEPTEDAQKFLDNPRSFLRDAFTEFYRETAGPVERMRASEFAEDNLERERAAFDAKFGAGQFEKIIQPELQESRKHMTGEQAARIFSSRHELAQLVNIVKGSKADTLVELAGAEAQRAAEEAKTKDPANPGAHLFGPAGAIPAPPRTHISEFETNFMDRTRVQDKINWGDGRLDTLTEMREGLASGRFASEDGSGRFDLSKIAAALPNPNSPAPSKDS